MKKKLLSVILFVICLSVSLSGCQDTSSIKTQKRPRNVYLDSTIVEFANVTYSTETSKSGGIESVTVGWLFHNIAGRVINAKIDVKFYDKNNLCLYTASKYINNIPPDFIEHLFQDSNKVTYGGAGAGFVDHVVITVKEI